jgi:hypothetical protein
MKILFMQFLMLKYIKMYIERCFELNELSSKSTETNLLCNIYLLCSGRKVTEIFSLA